MDETDPRQRAPPARAASTSDKALFRFLRTQLRPELGPADAKLSRVVNTAIAEGDLAPLLRLSPREKRTLLEMLDRRLSVSRRSPDPRSLVRLTDALVPLLPGEERLRAPGAPAR